jgi:hypothetical protein
MQWVVVVGYHIYRENLCVLTPSFLFLIKAFEHKFSILVLVPVPVLFNIVFAFFLFCFTN